jgi:hypothetical protein
MTAQLKNDRFVNVLASQGRAAVLATRFSHNGTAPMAASSGPSPANQLRHRIAPTSATLRVTQATFLAPLGQEVQGTHATVVLIRPAPGCNSPSEGQALHRRGRRT